MDFASRSIERLWLPGLLLLLGSVQPFSSSALAGPNTGGFLILHAAPSQVYTTGMNFCGWSDLREGKDAVTEIQPETDRQVVVFVLAVFPDYAMPRVWGVTFGIDYNSSGLLLPWTSANSCGYFNVSDDYWPGPYTGTSVVFDEAQEDRVTEIAWFGCYADAGAKLRLIPHPTQGGYFGDDTVPADLDEIEQYGVLGIGTPGYNPCQSEEVLGACCNPNGQCILQTRVICESFGIGYTYVGENTECLPNPCTPGMGACCVRGDCEMMAWDACLRAAGSFMGQGTSCQPTPCNFSEYETSWGNLKNIYRDH